MQYGHRWGLLILTVFYLRLTPAFAVCAASATDPGCLSDSDFFKVSPKPFATSPLSNAELNAVYYSGVSNFDVAWSGNIYAYPMTRGGIAGAPLLNGCYDSRHIRLGGFDSGTTACDSYKRADPTRSIFRYFVGYKIDCDGTAVAGVCQNTILIMNCTYEQVQVGTGFGESHSSSRLCSAGSGIVRQAKANAATVPTNIGCYPGQDGSTYPICKPCASGTFNNIVGNNTTGCYRCSDANTIANAAVQPAQADWFTIPATGAVSAGDCRLNSGASWSCEAGWVKSTDEQRCTAIPPGCTLTMTYGAQGPATIGASNGKITATYANAIGAVTTFSIISPSPMSGTGSDPIRVFSSLPKGTYTIKVADQVCSVTALVELNDPCTPRKVFDHWKCGKDYPGKQWVNECFFRTVCADDASILLSPPKWDGLAGSTSASGGDTGTHSNCVSKRRLCSYEPPGLSENQVNP